MRREGRRYAFDGGCIVGSPQGSVLQRPGGSGIFEGLAHIKVDGVDLLIGEHSIIGQAATASSQRTNGHAVRGLRRRGRSALNLRCHDPRAIVAGAALDGDTSETA